MRKKIFYSMCSLVIVSVFITAALITGIMYHQFYSLVKHEAKKETEYITAALDLDINNDSFLNTVKNATGSSRITLIDTDGKVLFDSDKNAELMTNHYNRPEVINAINYGSGEAERLSQTLGKQTFYYAMRLKNGKIIRIANTTESIYSMVLNSVPYLIIIAIVVFILAMFIAKRQTKTIVKPINSLDLQNPLSNDVYDELSPLLTRIEGQKEQIKNQIDELKAKQEEFTAITENMSEGLIVLDNNANILSINKSALSIFKVKENECLGKHILIINRSTALQKAVAGTIKGTSCEEYLSLNQKQYQLLVNPVRENGKVNGTVILILDVTAKQAAEKMRREFSANVSHELKTPLTSIFGYAEIIKNDMVKPKDIKRFSERIYTETKRLISLIEDIIKLSRLDENDINLPYEDVDLLSLSQEVCTRLNTHAEQKNITLEAHGENITISGVKQILEEMLYNLCDNAVKYNYENGKVDVNISQSEEEIIISITDTGMGIPKEDQDRIFERFYRVDKSHSKETGGTGLGLSIVKHGAILHNAKIELQSVKNKGTTVKIIFPNV